jgi:multiple sugar transport system substrate-binding protein
MHDASAFLKNLTDPSLSLFADEIAFAPMPAGPGGNFQTTFGWGAAISSYSKNKDAAWYFIQWWTSPEVVQRSLSEGSVVGGRSSTEFGDDIPEDYAAAIRAGLVGARSQLPSVVRVPQAREILGQAIVTAIEGGDVAAAARKANDELQVLIDEDFDAADLIN